MVKEYDKTLEWYSTSLEEGYITHVDEETYRRKLLEVSEEVKQIQQTDGHFCQGVRSTYLNRSILRSLGGVFSDNLLIARVNENLVGILIVSQHTSIQREYMVFHVSWLCSRVVRKGVGKALLLFLERTLLDILRKSNSYGLEITLEAAKGSERFYDKMGFQEIISYEENDHGETEISSVRRVKLFEKDKYNDIYQVPYELGEDEEEGRTANLIDYTKRIKFEDENNNANLFLEEDDTFPVSVRLRTRRRKGKHRKSSKRKRTKS